MHKVYIFFIGNREQIAMNNRMLLKACKTISSKVVVYHTKLFIMVEVSACNCQHPLAAHSIRGTIKQNNIRFLVPSSYKCTLIWCCSNVEHCCFFFLLQSIAFYLCLSHRFSASLHRFYILLHKLNYIKFSKFKHLIIYLCYDELVTWNDRGFSYHVHCSCSLFVQNRKANTSYRCKSNEYEYKGFVTIVIVWK